jgi:hypothetical protein
MPICKTPNGGQHMYFKAPDETVSNNTRLVPGCDFRGDKGYVIAPPSINNRGEAYEWETDLSLGEVELPPLPQAYIKLINNSNVERGADVHINVHKEMFAYGRRDNDLFHTANCLVKGGMPAGEISQVLNNLILSWGEAPDQKWIDAKIKSALKRAQSRETSLAKEVREWVMSTKGQFLSTDVHKNLDLSTRPKMKNVSGILGRLCDEGVIERCGNRHGCFRRVEGECEVMDFLTAPTETTDIVLPFDIHEKVEIMPGNTILVAGEVNSGKTAFLLNIIKENMHSFEVYYFNSEMGSSELKKRLSLFNRPLGEWNFKAYERSDNFGDVIKPGKGKINIIDFLELHDNFYEVGGKLAEIHKKLKDAIAVVAIQKNPGVDVGLGGYRNLEKPRLALSMSPGKIKIVKAKNWKTTENPNGLELEFKLVQGCKFIEDALWIKVNK